MLSMAASMRVKSLAGSLSSCLCALLARLTLQAGGALGTVLLIGDRFTGRRFGAAAFDGAEFRGRGRGFRDGLVGELLWPNDDGAAFGGDLDKVAQGQADSVAHGFGDAHLVIAGETGNCGRIRHGNRVPYNDCSRQSCQVRKRSLSNHNPLDRAWEHGWLITTRALPSIGGNEATARAAPPAGRVFRRTRGASRPTPERGFLRCSEADAGAGGDVVGST